MLIKNLQLSSRTIFFCSFWEFLHKKIFLKFIRNMLFYNPNTPMNNHGIVRASKINERGIARVKHENIKDLEINHLIF